jgi:hypothetical protein
MIYVIALQLKDPAHNEEEIEGWIRSSYENWTHPVENIWIVDGPLAADQIFSALHPLLGRGDRMVIVKGALEAMWHGVSPESARWFADFFPGSWSERIPGKTEGIVD